MTTYPSDTTGTLYCRDCDEFFPAGSMLAPAPNPMPGDHSRWNACPFCVDTESLSTEDDELCRRWERQQEDHASEPPPTAAERHQAAWDEKQRLRR